MNLEQYARAKQSLLRRMIAALIFPFRQFLTPFMTRRQWTQLMSVTYVIVKRYRDEATELARQFYDDNRAEQLPEAPRHDIFKDDHFPRQWMQETLEPAFREFERTNNADTAIEDLTQRVIKVVEDGARRTIIQGVASDTSQRIRGWARFDPRPPTCAFCTMLISRGPVYHTKGTAGITEVSQDKLERTILDGTQSDIDELLNRWHPGCTCIAVPVYKLEGYQTEAQEEAAFDIYDRGRKNAEKVARREGVKLTTRLILNEMRKLIYKPQKEQDEVTLTRNVA